MNSAERLYLITDVEELARLLNLGLTREQIDALYELIDAGINPEALIAAVQDFSRAGQ